MMISNGVKERPILMSGPMVIAILEDRKINTRRVVKPQPNVVHAIYKDASIDTNLIFRKSLRKYDQRIYCPYGMTGDHLWVRETWVQLPNNTILYRATDEERQEAWTMYGKPKWKPSIFMPRWASRITLEITNIRVERLQEITEEDAGEEGWPKHQELYPDINTSDKALLWFQKLWDSINGKKYPWASNPWVWVIEFARLKS